MRRHVYVKRTIWYQAPKLYPGFYRTGIRDSLHLFGRVVQTLYNAWFIDLRHIKLQYVDWCTFTKLTFSVRRKSEPHNAILDALYRFYAIWTLNKLVLPHLVRMVNFSAKATHSSTLQPEITKVHTAGIIINTMAYFTFVNVWQNWSTTPCWYSSHNSTCCPIEHINKVSVILQGYQWRFSKPR